MAEKLDANNKRENNEGIIRRGGRETTDEATTDTTLHSRSGRAWEHERLLTASRNNRRANVSMRKRGTRQLTA